MSKGEFLKISSDSQRSLFWFVGHEGVYSGLRDMFGGADMSETDWYIYQKRFVDIKETCRCQKRPVNIKRDLWGVKIDIKRG